jgi:RNA polymerase sigma factor (sigma-70 family)
LDDNDLMAQVIAGEIDKLGILYERYKKPLFVYFFKLTTGDRQTSEDLVHTVFYRIIKYRTSFTGQGNFLNWLFRIAHNAGIDHNRKLKRHDNYRNDYLKSNSYSEESKDLEKKEEKELLDIAMRILSEEERELLVLGKIECLRYQEIAEILNISESNVKIRMFRAIRKLKDIYMKLETRRYEKTGS